MSELRAAAILLLAGPILAGCGGGGERAFTSVGTPTDLTCVPYAENVTGIVLPGDAYAWWGEATGRYMRVRYPATGAALIFRPTAAMPLGHVAVVTAVLSHREILVDHANWVPYRITWNQPVVDVSPTNNWSRVLVWYPPIGTFGTRAYPVYGFILPEAGLATHASYSSR